MERGFCVWTRGGSLLTTRNLLDDLADVALAGTFHSDGQCDRDVGDRGKST